MSGDWGREALDDLVARLPDAAMTADRNMILTRFNAAAERLYQVSAESVLGQPLTAVGQESDHDAMISFHELVISGATVEPRQTIRFKPDGTLISVSVSGMPIRNASGEVVEVLGLVRDITAHDPRALIRTFGALVSSIPDSIVTVDTNKIVTSFNVGAERLYGCPASHMLGKPVDILATDPDSQHAFLDRVLAGEVVPASHTVRPLRNGRNVHVIRSASPLHGVDGEVIGVCLIARDITAEVEERQAREQAEYQLRRSFDEAQIAMAIGDLNGCHTDVNDAACRLLGRQREELLGSDWTEFTHPSDKGGNADAMRRALGSEARDRHVREKRYLLPDGRIVWAEVHGAVIRNPDGSASHFIVQIQDITHRRREETRLRRMAEHDHLTGLLNRHGFKTMLDAHLTDVGRRKPAGALLLIDLDNFKHHNDTYGHQAGDALLVCVGECLSQHLRGSDIAGRMGGDEFVVLLPHADRAAAQDAARKLLRRIESAAEAVTGPTDKPITASVGIACFDDIGAVTDHQVLALADSAMYQAKGAGKNQYATHVPMAVGS